MGAATEPGPQAFGRMVDRAIREQGWKQQQLAVAIGILPDGTTWDATRVRRLREGRARLEEHLTAIGRIIELLGLDPPTAWHAAGLKPPWLDEAAYRRTYEAAPPRKRTAPDARRLWRVGAAPTARDQGGPLNSR